MTDDPDDMMHLTDAAKALGLSAGRVRAWAVGGKIRGAVQREGRGVWLVPRAEVDRIRAEREATDRQGAERWQPMMDRGGPHR